MKKLMLIIASSILLMFSGSVFAFCVFNNLDSEIRVSCDDSSRMLKGGSIERCEGIEVSPNSHVCVTYPPYAPTGGVIVTALVLDENYKCKKSIKRLSGTMHLYYEKFLWIFNVSINCDVK